MTADRARAVRLVGVDVATQPKNVGLACGTIAAGEIRLEEVVACRTWAAIDAQVQRWLQGWETIALLALDAPLGWPSGLGDALSRHRAGSPMPGAANALFRRKTDDVVAAELGKRPLDVGADRIARTAHTALGLLARLRDTLEVHVPLAWDPGGAKGISAIEVYPAGTLASRGWPSAGYKGGAGAAEMIRSSIVEKLWLQMEMPDDVAAQMQASDHLLDAALCCFAAADFVRNEVMAPDDLALARREGWIWVSPPR